MTIDCSTPRWLAVMRTITGLTETPGDKDNPKIMGMRNWIACTYSNVDGMMDYCEEYTHDSVAWCGLTAAFCVTVAGSMPPFEQGNDTSSFLWALSWADDPNFRTISEPILGCIVVMEREGGGHVTMFESKNSNGTINCRGGNQSDAVNVQAYDTDMVVAYVWPANVPIPIPGPTPPHKRPELEKGDTGADVASVQHSLGLPVDSEFGPVTDAGVKGFQRAMGLGADGVVGEKTWAALDDLDARMEEGGPLSESLEEDIYDIASDSPLQSFSWHDRGRAPPGYYAGMGMVFAFAVTRLNDEDPAAEIMAAKATTNADKDALAWYADEFRNAGMSNSKDGVDTLRHLFVMMVGLGMCESSGNHWEGRDMSATNVESDTCEAGLFQSSWNLSNCAGEIDDLFNEFSKNPNGFRPTFSEGLSPNTGNLDNYGSGTGCYYQWLAKYCPAFAALMTGVGMRKLRQHWGPINRREVQIVNQVDDFLKEVQAAVEDTL